MEQLEKVEMEESLNKLSVQYIKEKQTLFTALSTSFRELRTSVEIWEQTYVLTAPQTGILNFNSFWKKNQYVNKGDKVFAIISPKAGKLVGKIKISASGAGKIVLGQRAIIKAIGFPYLEFGTLEARVKNISFVSSDDYYTIEVALPNGLVSNVGKKFKFNGEINGNAEIITENRSLAERIYSPIRYLAKNSF